MWPQNLSEFDFPSLIFTLFRRTVLFFFRFRHPLASHRWLPFERGHLFSSWILYIYIDIFLFRTTCCFVLVEGLWGFNKIPGQCADAAWTPIQNGIFFFWKKGWQPIQSGQDRPKFLQPPLMMVALRVPEISAGNGWTCCTGRWWQLAKENGVLWIILIYRAVF